MADEQATASHDAVGVSTTNADRSRLGPRPLALHVAHAETAWRRHAPERLAEFFCGVKAYRDHPYRRVAPRRSRVWRRGATALIDYGPSQRWPLLVVPSLINRAYVLDLMPNEGESLLSFLREGGMRPFLLDWGQPGLEDRRLSLEDLILDRMDATIDWLIRETGRRPLILGYCLGGTLATAIAARRKADVAGLALLAAPWDFQADRAAVNMLHPATDTVSYASGFVGSVSIDHLQSYFAALDPMAVPRKFADFCRCDSRSKTASRFVAIEDWLNDGVPFGAEQASKCLMEFYAENAPARGHWKIGGAIVEPEEIDIPAFLAIPSNDRIVPAESALALARGLPRAEVIRPASGHVGMVVGAKAREQLWHPLLAWLIKATPQGA